jgi:hypothetical protein
MDEIFADMQKENALAIKKQRSKYEATQSSLAAKNKKGASIEEMIKLAEAKQKKEKKKEKKERKDQSEKIKSAMTGLSLELDANKKTEIRVDDAVEGEASMASQTAKQEVVTTDGRNLGNLIARHISVLNTEADQSSRKRALQAIHDTLFIEYTTSDEDYCELFGDVCKTIFKRYNDKVEKCRDLAYRISTGTIGYLTSSLIIPLSFSTIHCHGDSSTNAISFLSSICGYLHHNLSPPHGHSILFKVQ